MKKVGLAVIMALFCGMWVCSCGDDAGDGYDDCARVVVDGDTIAKPTRR